MNENMLLSNVPDANMMIDYAMEYLLQGFGFKAREIGPYRDNIRFDVLAISRYRREIRVIEVKSCRADFRSDNKWQRYLPYCTHFAFMAPKGVIQFEELPEGIGLIEVWAQEHEYCNGEKSYFLTHAYKRGCKKLQDKPDDEYYIDLLEAIIMRLQSEADRNSHYSRISKEIDAVHDVALEIRRLIRNQGEAQRR